MSQTSYAPGDFVGKARASWGDALPDWVLILAEACQRTSQTAVAKRLDYSGSAISLVIGNKYQKGDIRRVEQMVRGTLIGETVACPALGDIARNVCLQWQAKPYAATSSLRASMYRACRDNCPHSRISQPQGDDDA